MVPPTGWLEPVVRVQSVSESSVASIPDQYVKPMADRPLPESRELSSKVDIPTIDLAGLNGGPARCEETIKEVSDASKEWGFFQVINHGVSLKVMERVLEAWRGFFHLPMEEKQRYANSPTTYEGYGSRVGVEKGAILDWGDYFFLHLLPCPRDLGKWPSLPTSCRDAIEEYGRETTRLCRTLLGVMGMGLGLDVGHFFEAIGGEEAETTLRANYYPRCPQPDLTLGLSSHSDPGALTVLLPDARVDGLQIFKDNEWMSVHPNPNALIVNVGDQIQVLSNATYKSSEHRVVVNSEEERLSIAVFCNPKGDVPLKPAEALTGAGRPALYAPLTFNEYRLQLRIKGLKGRDQVESLKVV